MNQTKRLWKHLLEGLTIRFFEILYSASKGSRAARREQCPRVYAPESGRLSRRLSRTSSTRPYALASALFKK